MGFGKGGIGLLWWPSGKESACQYRRHKRLRFDPEVRKIPWSRKWQPTPAFLPGKFQGRGAWQGPQKSWTRLMDKHAQHTLRTVPNTLKC